MVAKISQEQKLCQWNKSRMTVVVYFLKGLLILATLFINSHRRSSPPPTAVRSSPSALLPLLGRILSIHSSRFGLHPAANLKLSSRALLQNFKFGGPRLNSGAEARAGSPSFLGEFELGFDGGKGRIRARRSNRIRLQMQMPQHPAKKLARQLDFTGFSGDHRGRQLSAAGASRDIDAVQTKEAWLQTGPALARLGLSL
ncbi:hypothetical protein CRG98_033834 [Punica granatum]|uniref:Uncharacterized protein n=1 Tax=Punica granatum TaxID=22663 RepID=A0A2I0IPD1_PUNGR|nr:hypothetical protein CRG98_033834 [Punica granatum]